MPIRLALDSEAVTFVGKEAISLVTPNQLRPRIDTPNDLMEFVNFEGLTRQTETIVAILMKEHQTLTSLMTRSYLYVIGDIV